MTDQEIQQLAREIAENKIPRCAIQDEFQWETLVYAKEKDYKEVIEAILRTHCIVSRKDVKEWVENASCFMPTSHMQTAMIIGAKRLFGKSTFEEKSEK